jgi:hypothetical protein
MQLLRVMWQQLALRQHLRQTSALLLQLRVWLMSTTLQQQQKVQTAALQQAPLLPRQQQQVQQQVQQQALAPSFCGMYGGASSRQQHQPCLQCQVLWMFQLPSQMLLLSLHMGTLLLPRLLHRTLWLISVL